MSITKIILSMLEYLENEKQKLISQIIIWFYNDRSLPFIFHFR